MKPFSFILCAALLALLSACGPPQPKYRTDYRIIPPSSPSGKMCANNCIMAQQNCRQNCATQGQLCSQNEELARERARREADWDYRHYVSQRMAQGKEIKRSRSSFERYVSSGRCDGDACLNQCMGDYHICHSNCGGQVIPNTYCVAYCNSPVPAAQ